MDAKILNKLLVMLVMMLASFSANADSGSSGNTTQGNGSAILELQAHSPKSKRMPSRLHLEVVYQDGTVTLLSDFYEGVFSLSFENLETGEAYEVSPILVGGSASLDLGCGEYQVNAIGEDGTLLAGFMQVF